MKEYATRKMVPGSGPKNAATGTEKIFEPCNLVNDLVDITKNCTAMLLEDRREGMEVGIPAFTVRR